MRKRLLPRWVTLALLAGLLVMPIFIALLWGVSSLLTAMDDASGGYAARCIALACGVLWVADLVCLVLVQGLNSLDDSDQGE